MECGTYRYEYQDNVDAAAELMDKYDEDLIGKIALNVLNHHIENKITYQLDENAKKVYERIINRFNEQFNLKYSGLLFSSKL